MSESHSQLRLRSHDLVRNRRMPQPDGQRSLIGYIIPSCCRRGSRWPQRDECPDPDDEVRVMFTTDRRSLILGSAAVVVSSALSRSYAQAPTGPYKLDPLPYPTNKNEPSIDAQTMEIHHDRHHAAYVNNL